MVFLNRQKRSGFGTLSGILEKANLCCKSVQTEFPAELNFLGSCSVQSPYSRVFRFFGTSEISAATEDVCGYVPKPVV